MKALLSGYRQSPRKMRVVADFIRGKTIAQALVSLKMLPRRASKPIAKLLNSAVANAKVSDQEANPEQLVIKEIRVDEGVTLKRHRARARGRSAMIRKRTSHVRVELVAKKK